VGEGGEFLLWVEVVPRINEAANPACPTHDTFTRLQRWLYASPQLNDLVRTILPPRSSTHMQKASDARNHMPNPHMPSTSPAIGHAPGTLPTQHRTCPDHPGFLHIPQGTQHREAGANIWCRISLSLIAVVNIAAMHAYSECSNRVKERVLACPQARLSLGEKARLSCIRLGRCREL